MVPNRIADAATEVIARGLSPNESVRGWCPKCEGGESREKSFVCSRDDRGFAYWNCFRAKCGYRGRIVVGTSTKTPKETVKRNLHQFTRPLEPLGPSMVQWWRHKFDINPGTDILWCPSLERYALKVFGPIGQFRGWILRDFGGDLHPKVLSYPVRDEPFIGWMESDYSNEDTEAFVVVEDWVSARKVSDSGFVAISLNGTTVNWEIAHEIREVTPKIHLALDKGTMALMVKYREQFSSLFERVTIWQLDRDLKYVSRKRIREAVIDGKTDFISNP